MKQAIESDECEVEDVPASALLSVHRKNRYGSVPGLDDEELADPDELERQVYIEYFGPILRLPVKGKARAFYASVDESGGIDWGAFGTVDFERTTPEFDKARYKAERLREKLGDHFIMVEIVERRLPEEAATVLEYVCSGIIEPDHIANEDMRALARLAMRARRLQKEITELEKASWKRRRARMARVLAV